MYNQSLIQQKVNLIESKYRFEKELKEIMEKYTVEENVVLFHNKVVDLQEGYFVPVKEYDKIEEAIREMNLSSQALHIISHEGDNHKFIVGDFYRSLNECVTCEKVFSIERMENVY